MSYGNCDNLEEQQWALRRVEHLAIAGLVFGITGWSLAILLLLAR